MGEGICVCHNCSYGKNAFPITFVIMAYRNHAEGQNGTIAISKEIVDLLAPYSQFAAFRIAQETNTIGVESDNLTFAHKSPEIFLTEVSIVHQRFSTNGQYRGIAIHDYDGVMKLISKSDLKANQ